MNVVLQIPDKLASRLAAIGPGLERRALEALVLESYRAGLMSKPELRETLGFAVINEVDGFLKTHGIYEPYDAVDLERERKLLDELDV